MATRPPPLDEHLRGMAPSELVRRHLAVRRRLLAAEAKDDLGANLRRLAGVHEKLEGELREAGGVGDEDAKDAQRELDDHALATIDVDKESLIERHLLAISKLTATEAECASLAATAEGVEEKNCELRAEIRRRKYARLGGDSARIDVRRVAQDTGHDDDDDDDARVRVDATRNASPPARPSSPPLIIRAAEESGMPFTLADAMAPCDEARVVVVEDGGTVIHVNAAWELLCGYSAEEAGVGLKGHQCPDSERRSSTSRHRGEAAGSARGRADEVPQGRQRVHREQRSPLYCDRRTSGATSGMTLSRSTHNSDDDYPQRREELELATAETASLSPRRGEAENGKVYVGGDPNCRLPSSESCRRPRRRTEIDLTAQDRRRRTNGWR